MLTQDLFVLSIANYYKEGGRVGQIVAIDDLVFLHPVSTDARAIVVRISYPDVLAVRVRVALVDCVVAPTTPMDSTTYDLGPESDGTSDLTDPIDAMLSFYFGSLEGAGS